MSSPTDRKPQNVSCIQCRATIKGERGLERHIWQKHRG